MESLFQTRAFVPGRAKPDLSLVSFIPLTIGLILYILYSNEWYAIPFLMIGLALMYFQRYYFDSGKQSLSGYLGRSITIDKEGISANGVKYLFDELENLVVDVNDYDGERIYSTYTIRIERGVNNSIRFNFNEKKYDFPFHIRSENHLKDLRAALDTLIVAGVEINVYYKGIRSTVF